MPTIYEHAEPQRTATTEAAQRLDNARTIARRLTDMNRADWSADLVALLRELEVLD